MIAKMHDYCLSINLDAHLKGFTMHRSLSIEQAPSIQTDATIATSSKYADTPNFPELVGSWENICH